MPHRSFQNRGPFHSAMYRLRCRARLFRSSHLGNCRRVVFCVGALFRTPEPVLESAAGQADRARTGQDVPIALREVPQRRARRPLWSGRRRAARL